MAVFTLSSSLDLRTKLQTTYVNKVQNITWKNKNRCYSFQLEHFILLKKNLNFVERFFFVEILVWFFRKIIVYKINVENVRLLKTVFETDFVVSFFRHYLRDCSLYCFVLFWYICIPSFNFLLYLELVNKFSVVGSSVERNFNVHLRSKP